MADLYRCSNCGERMRTPDMPCRKCGYQRKNTAKTAALYQVVLIDCGEDNKELKRWLIRQRMITEDQWDYICSNLPITVFESESPQKAGLFAQKINSLGGQAESGLESDHLHDVSTPDSTTPPKRSGIIGRLLPILFVILAVLSPLYSKYEDDIRRVLDQFKQNVLNQEDSMDQVDVVIARRKILTGEVITKEMLAKKYVQRQDAPEGAVPPLFLERIVGKAAGTDIEAGAIIVLTED